jgi:ABC-2 type transport system ATP-binding protein
MDEGRMIAIDSPSEMIDGLIRTGFQRQREVKAANLEDVFIHLTGHEMRDE